MSSDRDRPRSAINRPMIDNENVHYGRIVHLSSTAYRAILQDLSSNPSVIIPTLTHDSILKDRQRSSENDRDQ